MWGVCSHVILLGVVALSNFSPPVCDDISMTTLSNNLAETLSDFTMKLYKSVSKPYDNVLISPLSISTVLGMVLAGAKGNTLEQMKQVLNINNSAFLNFTNLISHLNSGKNSIEVKVANRIFVEESLTIKDDFTLEMKEIFQSEYGKVSFSSQPLAAKETINSWVSAVTNEKITELLTDKIDPKTQLVLSSAIYFKGFWLNQFLNNSTHIATFHLNSEQSVKIEMMYQKKTFGFIYDSELKAKILDLPYEKNAFSLIVILPDEVEGLSAIEHQLDSKKLNKLICNVRNQQKKLETYLPKFKLEEAINLNSLLSAMGMTDMFCPDRADLSGIVEDKTLYVEAVLHKAYIDVNEKGTEAAAATAVRITKRSLEILPQFHADHPFLFLIVENSQNLILFIGALKIPRAAERSHEEL